MKRFRQILLLLAVTIVLAGISSACAIKPANGETQGVTPEGGVLTSSVVPPHCLALWDLETGLPGFSQTQAYRMQTETSGEVTLNVFMRPQRFDDFNPATWERIGAGDSAVSRFRSLTTPEGLPYYLLSSAVNWDAKDENGWHGGTLHTQSLHLDEGGLCFLLDGETATDHRALDIVSLDTLRLLTAAQEGSSPECPDLKKVHEAWRTEFQNGPVSLSVTIRPPPFDAAAEEEWANHEGVSRKGSGADAYFELDRKTGPDAPLSAVIAYRSAIGLVEVRSGVPYQQRNEVSRSIIDFVTFDYVQDLIAQIVA